MYYHSLKTGKPLNPETVNTVVRTMMSSMMHEDTPFYNFCQKNQNKNKLKHLKTVLRKDWNNKRAPGSLPAELIKKADLDLIYQLGKDLPKKDFRTLAVLCNFWLKVINADRCSETLTKKMERNIFIVIQVDWPPCSIIKKRIDLMALLFIWKMVINMSPIC